MIDVYACDMFKEHLSSLRDTSKDTSNGLEYFMTNSDLQVINFDKAKTSYANSLECSEESAKSVDAIGQAGEHITFYEFKNGKVQPANVKNKIRDSLLIFLDVIQETIDFSRKNIDFILVYNHDKNRSKVKMSKNNTKAKESFLGITKHFLSKADMEFKGFDLEKYEKIFFREIHTYTEEEFKDYLSQHTS